MRGDPVYEDEYAHALGAEPGGPDEPFVGRDAELDRLTRAADPVVMLVGDMGTGKSALLDRAVHRAAADGGVRILRAEGSESEAKLAFSALHQLLRPVLAYADDLPQRQRAALQHAFGAGPATRGHAHAHDRPANGPAHPTPTPDPMLIGLAVLNLLSALGDQERVLVVLDDVQWFDRASLGALSFAARRLEGEPVTMLVAARDGEPPPGFGRHMPTLTLEPLDDTAANRLLDLQPERPTGRTRTRILDQAAGNPLALVELTKAAAQAHPHVPTAGPDPLPLTDHLERLFAARLDGLPSDTKRRLLLLAAMDSADSPFAAAARLPYAEGDPWHPAERAGLIRRTGPHLGFRHPLVRAAVYHAAPVQARREAHRVLADLLRDAPDRRAWHLAAASDGPDADVSAELERTAERARTSGGHAAAATALQRAAELAPGREDGARLLVGAAAEAVFTGELGWVEELTAAARARTDDPSLLASAAVQAGRLAILTSRHTAVFSRLADAAEELAAEQPAAALDLLAGAAVVRFYSGEEDQRRRIHDLLRRLPEDDATSAGLRAWVRAVSDPFTHRAELTALLPQLTAQAQARPEQLTAVGIMAWLLDETPQAVRAFDAAFDRWQARGTLPEGLGGAVAWAYVERGRWDQARESCARMAEIGLAAGLDHAAACAATVDAAVLAYQGAVTAARARADEALALIDPLESRSVAVYARRALAAAAAAEGAHETAYGQLRRVFTPDGVPVHYHASAPALADLAAAAVRCGRREEAAGIVERCAGLLGGSASPRLRALISRARGLLVAPGGAGHESTGRRGAEHEGTEHADNAESHFRSALAEPALEHWPFERAQVLLDLAEWLRRQRRVAEARAPLTEALEIFGHLGARPWTERARAEARAAGLDVTDAAPDALAELSPQQRQIIGLAARGLTNREIGERLFLSPRTVGSHLYRSFPKLGITARSQLRDLLAGAPSPAAYQD
ncbi:AAA family ATPase [Streptomyces sp. ODS28]|uniref:helix-turn-helix transcriptional regulator n=1 Tax=Streptomyces sp. ODS28 TaxID=3136688 RepID=UPI0031EBFE91